MPARNVNNCFGDGSPSWNVEFPAGSLTAAEIIAYLPHWLKSIDVIDRFIRNGGGAMVIVKMINEYRDLPGGVDMERNSVLIMMQNAMRYYGLHKWTAGKHSTFVDMSIWDSNDLRVHDFRVPRITHPKGGNAVTFNAPAGPVEFRDLALHVKKHPSGPDALDLTRCVAWACSHPQESWLFPDDYNRLVNLLGGARDVTFANSDSEAFTRRSEVQIRPLAAAALSPSRLKAPGHSVSSRYKTSSVRNGGPQSQLTRSLTQVRSKPTAHSEKRSRQPLTSLTTSRPQVAETVSYDDPSTSPPVMRLTRSRVPASSLPAAENFTRGSPRAPGKPSGTIYDGGIRRSTRSRKNLFDIRPDLPDVGEINGPTDEYNDAEYPTGFKRQRDNDGDIYQPASQDEFESSSEEHVDADDSIPPTSSPQPRGRPAAKKARQGIRALADAGYAHYSSAKAPGPLNTDPALTAAAKDFNKRAPIHLKPPVLDPGRLTVDRNNVWTFAEIGAQDPWSSALSSTRFGNGPRRSAPFRELYRLTQPSMDDASDWAENIRWAKEQYMTFCSKTWTEYDYHLEMITDHRRATHWVSEEAIRFGEL